MKVICNADDFGYSRAVNYGVIDCYKKGLLTSATMMAGMPGFDHAVALTKQHPQLGVGVHLTLTCGQPVLKDHQTLVDAQGYFYNRSFYLDEKSVVSEDEVYREWEAQIEKVIAAGVQPTHLDSHHHSHTFRNHMQIINALAKKYNLPIRRVFDNDLADDSIRKNDILIYPWDQLEHCLHDKAWDVGILIKNVIHKLEACQGVYEVVEVMWHPAYLDESLLTGSSFAYPRIYEVVALQDSELITYVKNHFQLCTFQDI